VEPAELPIWLNVAAPTHALRPGATDSIVVTIDRDHMVADLSTIRLISFRRMTRPARP
jgi:hypothetical protein